MKLYFVSIHENIISDHLLEEGDIDFLKDLAQRNQNQRDPFQRNLEWESFWMPEFEKTKPDCRTQSFELMNVMWFYAIKER